MGKRTSSFYKEKKNLSIKEVGVMVDPKGFYEGDQVFVILFLKGVFEV